MGIYYQSDYADFSPPAAARIFVAADIAAAGGNVRSNKNLLRNTEGCEES